MEKFTYFWGKESPFSQWHESSFTDHDNVYNCAEQYMMYQKAKLFGDFETAKKILLSNNPKQHKALGREVKNFSPKVWNEHKIQIVSAGSYLKFSQNSDLREALMATKGTTLVEASPYDDIWGIKLKEDDPRAKNRSTWRGQNLLGEILTQLRIAFEGDQNAR